MPNPCDKRVAQLVASLNNTLKVVEGLNAQVSAQAIQLDAAAVEVDAAEAKVLAQQVFVDEAQAKIDAAEAKVLEKLEHIAVQTQVIDNQQQEIARLEALLNQPPPPAEPQTVNSNTIEANVEVTTPKVEG